MFIGIDGNEANVKNRVGSNVYSFELLWQLKSQISKLKTQNQNLKFKIFLKEKPFKDLPEKSAWWEYKVIGPKFGWTQWRLPLELYFGKNRPDIFFTPGHYAPRFSPIPGVISIMDLAFLRYPEQFRKSDLYQLVNWTRYSVNKAAHIFTISEFTKKEIIHFYNYPEEKITVTYPGMAKTQNSKLKAQNLAQSLKLKYNINGNYFVYVGTLQPRKNIIKLIEAFSEGTDQISNVTCSQLVIVGKKGWLYDEIFNKVKQLGLEDRVIFAGYVSEEEKQVLLENAIALVLPSLYEGFGIPVVEAMQVGCPVVISRNSSLPEVGGEAAIYIDEPQKAESIQKALLKVLKLSPGERNNLIKKGINQAKKFSWEECGRKTLFDLKEMLRKDVND